MQLGWSSVRAAGYSTTYSSVIRMMHGPTNTKFCLNRLLFHFIFKFSCCLISVVGTDIKQTARRRFWEQM